MQDNVTIDAYDKYAQVYDDEVVSFWENFPQTFLDRFANQLPGKRILNVGSGSGRDALLLQKLGLEVVCIDASTSMIDMTTKLGFESHLADFKHLDFPEHSFDGIWAYTSLIHITKDEAREVIRKLQGFLKPNGLFAIGVIAGETAGMIERRTMPGVARYFKNYTKYELRELVEPLGFAFVYERDYQPHNSIYLNQLYKKQ